MFTHKSILKSKIIKHKEQNGEDIWSQIKRLSDYTESQKESIKDKAVFQGQGLSNIQEQAVPECKVGTKK